MKRSIVHSLLLLFMLFLLLNPFTNYGSKYELFEIAYIRLEHLSFYMGLIVAITIALSKMSASYRKDFPSLPKLGYFKSLGIVLVFGAVFNLIIELSMDTKNLTYSPSLIAAEIKSKQPAIYRVTDQEIHNLLKQIRHIP